MRDRIASVLLHGHTPDERTGTLIALLSAVDQADWAAGAVREAIIAARQGVESGFSDGGGGGD
nr:hypothetical protein [Nocardioides sp. YR527]